MTFFFKLGGILVTAFVVALSGAMMPGPLLAVTVSESTRRGASAGPLLVLGHMILESVLVAAVALGVAEFLQNRLVLGCIGLLGGAMMCWMGQGMLRAARGLSLRTEPARESSMHPVLAGSFVSLSNPYWTIWWATIGITYIMMGKRFGVAGVVAFFVGHILGDLAWYSLVSVGIARGTKIMSDRVYRGLISVCGVVLVGFGLWFLWTGWAAVARRDWWQQY